MKSKKVTKKLLSLIIASIMIVTMLPVSAFAAESDVMIEDQAEAIVEEAADVSGEVVEEAAEVPDIEDSEDAAIVEGSVDEIAEADPEELTGYTETLSFTAQGVKSGSKMHFDAQLTGLSVSAVVPAKRAAKGSVMTADIVDVSAYEDAVAKKNYGKSIAGLYGLELHFYDKKGKEIKHINTSDITVTVDGLEASSYFIGRIDNKVKKIQRGTEPTFTFTEKKAYTYVIAGLEDDGLVRASGEADGEGNKRFNLSDENVNIEVIAPEGAFADDVAMEASDATAQSQDVEEELVGASESNIVAAYEISFYNEDGAEQQPKNDVTVKIAADLDMSKEYTLIHIADNGEQSEVENAVFTEDGVEFVTDSFSVYAVIEGGPGTEDDQPYRTTYEFYESDGTTPYVFKNKIGEEVDNQILKNGEVLEDVGLPTGSDANSKFLGWYDESGNLVPTDEPKTVTETKTIKLIATFETVYNITFMTAEISSGVRSVEQVKQVTYVTGQTTPLTVVTDDVTTEAPDSTKALIGWNTDPSATVALESPITVTGNTVLYPIFANASWLYFDENDGGHEGGASYTPPQFVLTGAKPKKPDDPHRTGYRFDGWYREPECTNAFDFNQVLNTTTTVYAKWTGLEADYTIVIRKQRATDSVDATDAEKTYDYEASISRKGNIGAAVTIPTEYAGYSNQESVIIGDKESNFIGFHYNGTKTNSDNAGKTIAADGSTVVEIYYDRNIISISFDYPASSSSTETVTIYEPAENGGYYYYNDPYDTGYYEGGKGPTPNATLTHHRGLVFEWTTFQIFGMPRHTHYHYDTKTGYYRVGEGPTPNAPGTHNRVTQVVSGTEYPADTTWRGLFGATFAETGYTWPSTYEVKYHSGGNTTTNTVNTLWEEVVEDGYDSTILVFLDAFILPDPTETEYYLRPHSTGNVPIRFFQQNVDGSWPTDAADASYTVTSSGGRFMITDKYNGFKAYQYRTGNGSWTNLPSSPNGEGVYATVPSGYSSLEIRFERNSYDLEFRNGEKGTQGVSVKTQSIKYQAELATTAQAPTVTYPIAADADHYDFVGWFSDPEFTTYVSFTELTEAQKDEIRANTGATYVITYKNMPANNLVLYAGWALKGYDCALNPNGGTLREGDSYQAGVFWLQYGNKISDSIMSDTTREGYELVGWMVSTVDGELLDVQRDPERGNLRFVGDFSNWTMTNTPWNFDTEITGPVYLTAKWRSTSAMSIVYDAKAGSGAPTDGNKYMDGSKSVVLEAPTTLPSNKLFKGWHIVGSPDSEIYSPGYTFTVDSTYATNNIITLEAIYTDVNNEEVLVTSITWHANNGTDQTEVDGNLQINAKVPIKPASTFSYTGYEFIGWAKSAAATESDLFLKYENDTFKAKDGNNQWVEVTDVAADLKNPAGNDLYAVWVRQYFYIFHSSTGELEAVEMKSGVDLTTYVSGTALYGGYYSSYGAYTVTDADKKSAKDAATKKVTVTTNTYNGTSLYVQGTKRYWTKADAGRSSGKNLVPTPGAVYYLKEVPNCYLATNARWVYDWNDNDNIKAIYLLTGIDDTYYSEVGFVVTTKDEKGKIVSKFSYQQRNSDTVTTISAASLIGQRGYLGVVDASKYIATLSGGTSVSVQPYWKTIDSVKITTKGYTFENEDGEATLTKNNLVSSKNE